MDPFKGILVQVISNGQILKSYDNPDPSDNEDPYQCQRYIEAVSGATFAVKVIITDQFDFCHISPKDGVAVCLDVDGNDWADNYHETREDIEEGFEEATPCIFEFDEFTHFSDKTGRWMKSEYSFNALELNESSCVNLPAQVQDLGKIEVRVKRVKVRRCKRSRRDMIPVKTIMEVSERALKGKAVENIVKLTEGVPAKAPKQYDTEIEPISGRKGIPLVYKILYRSKRALQMIGCLPPDPSSPAITLLDDEEQDSASGASPINANAVAVGHRELQQQVQSLRAQLALLERTLNVKPESQEANTPATPQRPRNIKREREEDENAAPRQRRRISAKVETIDLTDD